jgi:hypothetical protein
MREWVGRVEPARMKAIHPHGLINKKRRTVLAAFVTEIVFVPS